MRKFNSILIGAATLALVASGVFAETDPKALPILKDIREGKNNKNAIKNLYVTGGGGIAGALVVGGDSDVGGDLTVSGSQLVSGLSRDVPTALSVTNGQPVTIAEQSYLVTGIDGETGWTNTITLAAPGTALLGLTTKLTGDVSSTNLFGIADSGTCHLTATWLGGPSDMILLYAITTTNWVELGRNVN